MATAEQWLAILAVGALAGAAGQGARVIVGMKKLGDEAQSLQSPLRSLVVPSQLFTSLLIGAIAGIIGVIANGIGQNVEPKDVMALLFIGYAGTDFIEGIIRREKPAVTAVSPTTRSVALDTGPQIRLDDMAPGAANEARAVG
jgi:hypothetical protein